MTSNSEEIKPEALSIVKLCLAGGIGQAVSQSVNRNFSQNIFKHFIYIHRSLLDGFGVTLKTFTVYA